MRNRSLMSRVARHAMLTAALLAPAGLYMAAGAAPANAENLSTLEASPESPATVVTEPGENAYTTWERKPPAGEPATFFCRIPAGQRSCTHPIQLPAPSKADVVQQPFVVIGAENEVTVVGTRYVTNTTELWSSTNNGETFSAPREVANVESEHTSNPADIDSPEDVLLDPQIERNEALEEGIYISTDKVGFASTGTTESTAETLNFKGLPFYTNQPSLGFTTEGQAPVLAYWADEKPYEVGIEYLTSPFLSTGLQSHWTHKKVTDGYVPRLASGPHGLYMLSVDNTAADGAEGAEPTQLDVRKWDEAKHEFGSPTLIATVPATVGDLFTYGGFAENPLNGTLYATYPEVTSRGEELIRLWELEEPKAGEILAVRSRVVASFDYPLDSGVPERIAVGPGGAGWLTFKDGSGDQLASLKGVPTLHTTLSGGGVSASPLAVTTGTPVHDSATLSGGGSEYSGGTLTYSVYSSSSCSVPSLVHRATLVANGDTVGSSPSYVLKSGVYYWKADYSGNYYAAAVYGGCHSEVLTVGKRSVMGLAAPRACAKTGHCRLRLHDPRGVRLTKLEVFVNGRLVRTLRIGTHGVKYELSRLRRGTDYVTLLGIGKNHRFYAQSETLRRVR